MNIKAVRGVIRLTSRYLFSDMRREMTRREWVTQAATPLHAGSNPAEPISIMGAVY